MQISDTAFKKIKELVNKTSGIYLSDLKKQMVASRLVKRIRHYNNISYDQYYEICLRDNAELQIMIDIITTNETSFFREKVHFDFMKNQIIPKFKDSKLRVWSAAASIGAEAYSIAMMADDLLASKNISLEVVGTDINTDVIQKAKIGLYPMSFASSIDSKYLKAYCLQGFDAHEGYFLIDDYLRKKCSFLNANLMVAPSPQIGKFDIIFLRNMLIYFDGPNKKIIVENVTKALKHGGYLFLGHSETLSNVTNVVKQVQPTIYKREAP